MRLLVQNLENTDPMPSVRSVFGGWLVQEQDQVLETKNDFQSVTEKKDEGRAKQSYFVWDFNKAFEIKMR